jgi:ATP-dependent Clp protease ATP-binding subunit ClpX
VAHFEDLTRKMLVRIMIEPKDSIYNQFRDIFATEGVGLTIEPKVFDQIAEVAFEYKTGARSLRGIFEELITPILYVIPDDPTIGKVTIVSLFADPLLEHRTKP